MRYFYSFLIVFVAVMLLFLDVTQAVYDYCTNQQTNNFTSATAAGITSSNVTIITALYNNAPGSFVLSSNLTTDVPEYSSYNTTNRVLTVSGLTANTTRRLTVQYDVSALSGAVALDNFMNVAPYIYYIIIFMLAASGMAYMWFGKKE